MHDQSQPPHERWSAASSKFEIAQGRVVIGTTTKLPVVSALVFPDREVVDAGNAQTHQAVLVELPILVAIAAKPIPAVVVPLVGETNRDAVFPKCPDFLDQPVVEFTLPFTGQECFDGGASL